MIPFPNKKFKIIYADPPWTYNDKASAGSRGSFYKYDLMTIDQIKTLPVQDISDDDCVLFMWVTFPLLQEGLDTIRSWGFEYKTIGFNWVKKNKKSDSWFFGMGNWTRSNSEICLMGIKGKPKRVSASVSSILDARIGSHSQKPEEAKDKIVELMGDIPRIELFARVKTNGWYVWGNQIESDV